LRENKKLRKEESEQKFFQGHTQLTSLHTHSCVQFGIEKSMTDVVVDLAETKVKKPELKSSIWVKTSLLPLRLESASLWKEFILSPGMQYPPEGSILVIGPFNLVLSNCVQFLSQQIPHLVFSD